MTADESFFRKALAGYGEMMDARWTDIAVAAHLAVLQERQERLHAKFGFVPHPDDATKCNCAYCARDFEAVADRLADAEEQLAQLEESPNVSELLNADKLVVA